MSQCRMPRCQSTSHHLFIIAAIVTVLAILAAPYVIGGVSLVAVNTDVYFVRNACLGYLAYLFKNLEVNDHPGNLIIICLMHEWRRKGADSVIIGALFGTDVSSSQYKEKTL